MIDGQRIAFLCHPYHRGGVTRWMADAAVTYAAQGLEVYFVTPQPVKEFHSAKGRETLIQLLGKKANNVKVISSKVGYEFEFGTPEYRCYVYKKLIAQLPQGTPIILSDDKVVWESAAQLYKNYPIVGVLHADEEHYYKLAEEFFEKVSVLVCVSRRIDYKTGQAVPGFDPARLFTIPCGICIPPYTRAVNADETVHLVYVGRVSNYQKRAGDLVKICMKPAMTNLRFRLTVIGEGDAVAQMKNNFKTAGLEKNVVFCGWLSQAEVAGHLAQSDILLLTSDFEGTPIAMMEALAAGCGMVGTRVSGIEDYEQHPLAADCLRVFEVGDIDAAVNKISELVSVPRSVREQSARKMAESEFSMEVCLKKYQDAIQLIPVVHNEKLPEISLPITSMIVSRLTALLRSVRLSFSK